KTAGGGGTVKLCGWQRRSVGSWRTCLRTVANSELAIKAVWSASADADRTRAVINLKTAKALGLTVPQQLLACRSSTKLGRRNLGHEDVLTTFAPTAT